MALIQERPDPIPFYGELGSVNPVVVTPGAAAARAKQIGAGITGSIELGSGQFCTEPGLIFVPVGDDGNQVLSSLLDELGTTAERVLLGDSVDEGFRKRSQEVADQGAAVVAGSLPRVDRPVPAYVTTVDVRALRPELMEEVFGPTTLVVRYGHETELIEALGLLPGSLAGTIHGADDENRLAEVPEQELRARCGRLVFNGYPTGVAVAWAQHDGGAWPATNSVHFSVGPTPIRRFVRPVTWQDAPFDLLPNELREGPVEIPRRVDGKVRLARNCSH